MRQRLARPPGRLVFDDVSPVIWQALDNETYEAKEAKWISKAVKPGDRVLELGSGIGIITSLIAQIPDVQVWAFEANPADDGPREYEEAEPDAA